MGIYMVYRYGGYGSKYRYIYHIYHIGVTCTNLANELGHPLYPLIICSEPENHDERKKNGEVIHIHGQ